MGRSPSVSPAFLDSGARGERRHGAPPDAWPSRNLARGAGALDGHGFGRVAFARVFSRQPFGFAGWGDPGSVRSRRPRSQVFALHDFATATDASIRGGEEG